MKSLVSEQVSNGHSLSSPECFAFLSKYDSRCRQLVGREMNRLVKKRHKM